MREVTSFEALLPYEPLLSVEKSLMRIDLLFTSVESVSNLWRKITQEGRGGHPLVANVIKLNSSLPPFSVELH